MPTNMKTEHQCDVVCPDGSYCGKTFGRRWNLLRHQKTQHMIQEPSPIVFRQVVVYEGVQDRSVPDKRRRTTPEPATATADLNVDKLVEQLVPHLLAAQAPWADLLKRIESTQPHAIPDRARNDNETSPTWLPRNRLSHEITPLYNTKESRKFPRQQKALLWLAQDAKTAFDRRAATLLQSWGVTRDTSTCVLVPAAWDALDPAAFFGRDGFQLAPSACPLLLDAKRLDFALGDHITTFGRSAAWFDTASWPRTGVQLDNFIECGPFQRMDGSHLCHNGLCINPAHITYEPTYTNQQRSECLEWARLQRLSGRDVPEGCEKHTPPCLLQHAVLTTYERCLIQLSVLREAVGDKNPASSPTRPSRHQYRTLEHTLPLQYQKTCIRRTLVEPSSDHAKPQLVCALCPRITSFSTVTRLWSHIIHAHAREEPSQKLAEVRRAAEIWREYVETGSLKKDETTMRRLDEVRDPATTWYDVLCWQLR